LGEHSEASISSYPVGEAYGGKLVFLTGECCISGRDLEAMSIRNRKSQVFLGWIRD
jgi:hypothetical protein